MFVYISYKTNAKKKRKQNSCYFGICVYVRIKIHCTLPKGLFFCSFSKSQFSISDDVTLDYQFGVYLLDENVRFLSISSRDIFVSDDICRKDKNIIGHRIWCIKQFPDIIQEERLFIDICHQIILENINQVW